MHLTFYHYNPQSWTFILSTFSPLRLRSTAGCELTTNSHITNYWSFYSWLDSHRSTAVKNLFPLFLLYYTFLDVSSATFQNGLNLSSMNTLIFLFFYHRAPLYHILGMISNSHYNYTYAHLSGEDTSSLLNWPLSVILSIISFTVGTYFINCLFFLLLFFSFLVSSNTKITRKTMTK